MKRIIGAAVAACALLWAGAAGAAVQIPLIDIGDGYFRTEILTLDRPADGPLSIVIDFDPDLTLSSGSMTWEFARDYWTWDPIHGNDAPYSHRKQDISYYCGIADACLTLSQPGRLVGSVNFELTPLDFECGADTPYGTLCGQSYRYRVGHFMFVFAGGTPGETRNITMSLSAAPEPATWAMLIAGFGLAGAALRRQRQALASC